MARPNNALVKHSGGQSGQEQFLPGPIVIPAADVSETGDAYVLCLDMPGAQKDAMSVRIIDDSLVIKAPVAPVHLDGATILHREIRKGTYERSFTLGEGIDRDRVEAGYENGVLTVRLMKSDAVKPKDIAIH